MLVCKYVPPLKYNHIFTKQTVLAFCKISFSTNVFIKHLSIASNWTLWNFEEANHSWEFLFRQAATRVAKRWRFFSGKPKFRRPGVNKLEKYQLDNMSLSNKGFVLVLNLLQRFVFNKTPWTDNWHIHQIVVVVTYFLLSVIFRILGFLESQMEMGITWKLWKMI